MSIRNDDAAELSVRRLGAIGASLVGLFSVGVVVFVFVGTATATGTGLFTRSQVLQLEAALTGALLIATSCAVAATRLWRSASPGRPPRGST